ncbi:uncharacterized protein BO72DRAFT_514992, partial [Aspergillus fijiensis CBS 313.89]
LLPSCSPRLTSPLLSSPLLSSPRPSRPFHATRPHQPHLHPPRHIYSSSLSPQPNMSTRAAGTSTAAAAAAASGAGGRKPNQGGDRGGGKGPKAGPHQDRKFQFCTRCGAFGHVRATCTRFVPPGTPRFVRPAPQPNNARARRSQRRDAAALARALEAGEPEQMNWEREVPRRGKDAAAEEEAKEEEDVVVKKEEEKEE